MLNVRDGCYIESKTDLIFLVATLNSFLVLYPACIDFGCKFLRTRRS